MSATLTTENISSYDVVILGAGYAGLIAALRLGQQKWGLRVALVNPRAQFLERVRLQESIVAPVTPRIPSISAFFAGTTIEFICGSVTSLNAEQRRIRITTDAQEREITFDQAIYALGSHVDVDNVPGAAEHAYRLDPGDGPVREDSQRHARNAKMENAVGATQLTVSGTHGHPDFDGSKRTCLSNRRNFHCHIPPA
jgi:NADH dehydrogenase